MRPADGTTAADLTHDAVYMASTDDDYDYNVDGGSSTETAPAVSRISFASTPASGDTYELGETIAVRVEFDSPVKVTGTPQLALTIGSGTQQVPLPEYYSDPDSGGFGSLRFEYTVQAADVDTDGVSIAANAISLNGGSLNAAADGTTDADLTHAAVAADPNGKVDGSRVTAPTVSRIPYNSSPASGDTYELGERIEVRVEFDRPVTVTGTPQVALTVGSRTRQATLPSYYFDPDSGGFHYLYFEYTVQAEDRDADGISIAANAISLNGGSIEAEADGTTDADLTHAAVAADANHKVDGSRVTTPTVSRISFNSSPASGDTYELGERIRSGGRVRSAGDGDRHAAVGADHRQPDQTDHPATRLR